MIRRAKCAISDKMRGDSLVRSRGRYGSSGLFSSAAAGADACGAQGVGALFAAGRPGRRQSVFSARFNRRELFLAACRPERWQPEFTGVLTGRGTRDYEKSSPRFSRTAFRRRGRDSNSWYGFTPYVGLANRWFQPLTHLSGQPFPDSVPASRREREGHMPYRKGVQI